MKKYIAISIILICFLIGCTKEEKTQSDELANSLVTTPTVVNKSEINNLDDIKADYDYDNTHCSNFARLQ